MLNSCVKYVNNDCITNSKNSVCVSTNNLKSNITNTKPCLQSHFKHQSTTPFYTSFSTSNNLKNNLLNNSFTHNPQCLLLELLFIN